MKKGTLNRALAIAVLLVTLATPAFAAPPPDGPGKGPRELGRVVFVHYGESFSPAKPGGKPDKGPKGEDKPYSYSGVEWADWQIPVHYWINSSTGKPATVSNLDTIEGVNAGFQAWEDDRRSYIDFEWAGLSAELTPGVDVAEPDGYNVVGWADLSSHPGAIAITVVWYLVGTGWIVDCDTALNNSPSLTWTQEDIGTTDPDEAVITGPGYDVDIQNIMAHEGGHWLQLDDLYDQIASEQTMYGIAHDGELKKRSLESGDVAGVRKIYPSRGGRK
jgi:hypothetical protein